MERGSPIAVSSLPDTGSLKTKDVAAFAYRGSMKREMQNECEVLIDDVNLQYVPNEDESADGSMYRNTISVEMK